MDFAGPLGQPSEIHENMGTIVCIGGGIGVAPVYPIARAMHEAGNKVISIMGAKTKDILIFEDKMRAISDEVLIATDDGSYGVKGFVTTALQQLVDRGEKIDQVTAIGPGVMMRSVVEATRPLGIKTIVSLNPVMVDATAAVSCAWSCFAVFSVEACCFSSSPPDNAIPAPAPPITATAATPMRSPLYFSANDFGACTFCKGSLHTRHTNSCEASTLCFSLLAQHSHGVPLPSASRLVHTPQLYLILLFAIVFLSCYIVTFVFYLLPS